MHINCRAPPRHAWRRSAHHPVPLLLACDDGHAEVAAFLLRKGAGVGSDGIMPDGRSFLHLAAKRGHVAVVEAIVSAHPTPAAWHKFLMGCGALSELAALNALPPAPNAPRNLLPRIYDAGQIRALGVSNFSPEDLRQLLAHARIRPHLVQSWMDPLQQARGLRALCQKHGVLFQAYSTLGTRKPWSRYMKAWRTAQRG